MRSQLEEMSILARFLENGSHLENPYPCTVYVLGERQPGVSQIAYQSFAFPWMNALHLPIAALCLRIGTSQVRQAHHTLEVLAPDVPVVNRANSSFG